MVRIEDIPTKDQLKQRSGGEIFSGSIDISMSTTVNGVNLAVRRPVVEQSAEATNMYGVFIEGKEVSIIGGSTEEAEIVYKEAKRILEMDLTLEEAKRKIREYIAQIHN